MKTDMILSEKFRQMAENVQASVAGVQNLHGAFARAVEIAEARNGKTLAAAGFSAERLALLKTLCDEKGIRLLTPPFRQSLNDIHTGLTLADRGIAETGTLVVDSASEDLRVVTMLSEIHVACLAASRIEPDSAALAPYLEDRMKNPPCYTAFITGASRTADIERVLTIGVHGPRELHILLMEEDES